LFRGIKGARGLFKGDGQGVVQSSIFNNQSSIEKGGRELSFDA
jgi:hypothetical protein